MIIRLGQDFEVIGQSPHPGGHLLFFGARQEADILTDRDGGAGHDNLAIELVIQSLGEAGGQGQQGLAGAGGAEQGDEIDVRVHQ